MTDADKYILDSIKTWVWSGFYGPADVNSMIDDVLENGADEAFLRSMVAPEFERKRAAEALWPPETDCDRLNLAFEKLNANRIIALHNAGYTMSDGTSDVAEVLHERGRGGVDGYCFYHGQDLERAVAGAGLMIAFGDLDEQSAKKVEIGQFVKRILEEHGFTVEWNGDPETRLSIPKMDWKRRSPVADGPARAIPPKGKLSNRQAYNLVTDTVTGPNIRLRDNVFQGICVLIGLILGSTIGALVVPDRLPGALVGAFIGLVVGILGSGLFLMIYRAARHFRGKHD